MKKNNFEQTLLNHKIVDHRNLYAIVVKKRMLIPSFKIMVMGLYKDKFVFYKISTSYRLIKYIEEIEVNDIDSIEIKNRNRDTILSLLKDNEKRLYFVLENNKNVYTMKKILKK